MRQLLVVGSLVSALALAAPTGAGERPWYLSLEAGAEFDGALYGHDAGWGGFVTVGRGLNSHLSLEAELGYRSTSDPEISVDIDQTSLMLNAIFEASLTDDLSASLGLGVGADRVHVELVGVPAMQYSDSEIELATQLKVGLSLALSESTELVANYRYMEMVTDSGLDNGTLTIGVRFDL
jgi:opacity protein-like surface antigen